MSQLTPEECFALYPEGSEGVVDLIRRRLLEPADPATAHRHHILALGRNKTHKGLLRYWSKALGREVEATDIPLVSVTPAEHFKIHSVLAFCYYVMGSKGRFRAHGIAAGVLRQFADLDEDGAKLLREIQRATGQALAQDPEWREKNRETAQARWQNPEYRKAQRALRQTRWQNPEYRKAQRAMGQTRWQDLEFRAKNTAAAQARSHDPEWQERNKAAMKTLWQDPEFREKIKLAAAQARSQSPLWRANNVAMLQSLTQTHAWRVKNRVQMQTLWQDPRHREKQKAAVQARHPDVVVIFPDGHEEGFTGQKDAARALGCSQASIGNFLTGKTKFFRGPLKCFSFRYADQDPSPEHLGE